MSDDCKQSCEWSNHHRNHWHQLSLAHHPAAAFSATAVAANNLRGVDVPVAGGVLSATITFASPEPDASYAVTTECSWLTVKAVVNKSATGFTAQFATAAPHGGGKLSWVLVR
jgi:hypothetical protein